MPELTIADVHALLLGLAGRAPDAWLAVTRASLAAGDHGHVVRMLTALAGSGLVFTEAEAALVATLAPGSQLRTGGEPATGHHFESCPDEAPATDLPDTVVALWRAVRGDGTVVHLAEAAPDADPAALTGELQRLVGDPVEVFPADADLSPYHEAALTAAVLVAAAPASVPIRVARVFDGADSRRGPFFDDRERVDERRRERLLDYLRGGEPVLDVDGALDDVLEPGVPVAAGFRSDGDWVWNDATVHYLDRHGVAPDPDLAAHVADRDAPPAGLPRSVRARVRSLLTTGPRDNDLATAWFAS